MNKTLVTINVSKQKLIDIDIVDRRVKLRFTNKIIELNDHHDQDCCEHVYADWSAVDVYKPQLISNPNDNLSYDEFVIKAVPDVGLLLCFDGKYSSPLSRVLVPCYNSQNGYYSSNLDLIVTDNGVRTTYDVSEAVEDCID